MKSSIFTDEILSALEAAGLETGCFQASEFPIVTAASGSGTSARFILLDPISRTPEQAADESLSIALLSGTGGERPIIIARDIWERRKDMMRLRMLAHCNIFRPVFARNCEVVRISRPAAGAFLSKTHSYGAASCRYCYGLRIKRVKGQYQSKGTDGPQAGDLVAAAAFSNARRWIKGGREIRSYEWVRYASLPGLRIAGGMGKILRQFISDVDPDDVMSYADLEWSDGDVYRKLGFNEESIKTPVLFRIDRNSWTRTPVRESDPGEMTDDSASYYRNQGSLKFRLKLTEY